MTKKNPKKFQQRLVEDLRNGKLSYQDAPIYTVLLCLCQDSSIDEVFLMLHDVAKDTGKLKELESQIEKVKETKKP